MHQQRAPQAVIAEAAQREPGGQEDHQRRQHQVAHVARPGRADIDAIKGKGEHREHGRGNHEQEEVARDTAHVTTRGHDVDQRGAEQRKHRRDRQRKGKAPHDDQPYRAGKIFPRTRAIGAAAELLGGIGEPVEKERADQKEIVEHGVRRQDRVAGARALRGEEQERRNERRGPDHDIAVDREHPQQLVALEQVGARKPRMARGQPLRDHAADGEARGFGNHGGDRSARNAEIGNQHQHDRRDHVDDVDRDLHAQRQRGAGLPDQPAQYHVIRKRQWGRPDTDDEVGLCSPRHALAAAHRAEQDRGKRHLQRNQRQADDPGHDQPTHQDRMQLPGFTGAERLCGERDRAHAQESKQPEQAVEDHGGHCNAAEQRRVAEPADRGGRDDADQWRRQVRDHRRSGDGEDLSGGDFRGGIHGCYSSTIMPSFAAE